MRGAASSSIGRRLTLTVLGTTALAVALACGGLALYGVREMLSARFADLAGLAEVIGFNSMLPLVSGDPAVVESTLLALTSNGGIEAAAVYARDGSVFARFARDYEGGPGIPERAPRPGSRAEADALLYVREIRAGEEVIGSVLLRASTAPLRRQVLGTMGVSAAAFVVCLAPALLATSRLRRSLAAPLAELARSAERLAAGDLLATVDVPPEGEIGVLARSFNKMADGLRGLMSEVAMSAHEVLAGARTLADTSRRSEGQAETQQASVDRTSSAIERMEASLAAVGGATDRLADATSSTAASANEVEASTRHVGQNVGELFLLIEDTASALQQSVGSIRQVGENTEHLDRASARAVSSLEQLGASVQSVGDAASHGLALSQRTAAEAQRGHRAVSETRDAMAGIEGRFQVLRSTVGELESRSSAIGEVVEVIDKIAAETNLLSLNASIVASQAGEHGRSFAVVATRIGRLAERTSLSTGEIAELIRSVQRSTGQAVTAAREGSASVELGVRLSREAGEILSLIMETAEESAGNVVMIANAAAEQSSAIGDVDKAFHDVRQGMLQIRGAVSEQGEVGARVHRAMERTSEVARQVQRAMAEQEEAVRRIAAAIHEIHSITEQVRDATQAQSVDARQILHALGCSGSSPRATPRTRTRCAA